MARYSKGARRQLKSGKRSISSFGVGHRLVINEDFNDFMSDIKKEAKDLEPVEFYDDRGNVTKTKAAVTFLNPQRLWLRIVERTTVERIGRANRFKWQESDKSIIQQQVVDEIGSYVVGGRTILSSMSVVPSLGDAQLADAGYHSISIGPSAETNEALWFAREHEIVVNGLKRRQPDPNRPEPKKVAEDPYIPHMTIGRVVHGITPEQHSQVIQLVQKHLPVDVIYNPIEFSPAGVANLV